MNERKLEKYIFFVDGKEIVTEHSSLTGQDIKGGGKDFRGIPTVPRRARR